MRALDKQFLWSIFFLTLTKFSCSFAQDTVKLDFSEVNDIDYMDGMSVDTIQKLNLVFPKDVKKFPLLIWIGGGAWSYVDRNVEMDLARKLAREGIAVASIGHRLSPATWRDTALNKGIQHPEHVKDVAAAMKWLFNQADTYGYDKEKIFIGGFSSGAHLAALIGLDFRYLEEVGLRKNMVKGMILISGTYDISNYHHVFKNGNNPELAELHVEAVFGDTKEDFNHASPSSYLDHLEIPMLLISDNAIDRYTRFFEEKLKETDFTEYNIIYVSDLNHAELWRNLSFDTSSDYRKVMIQYIKNKVTQ